MIVSSLEQISQCLCPFVSCLCVFSASMSYSLVFSFLSCYLQQRILNSCKVCVCVCVFKSEREDDGEKGKQVVSLQINT